MTLTESLAPGETSAQRDLDADGGVAPYTYYFEVVGDLPVSIDLVDSDSITLTVDEDADLGSYKGEVRGIITDSEGNTAEDKLIVDLEVVASNIVTGNVVVGEQVISGPNVWYGFIEDGVSIFSADGPEGSMTPTEVNGVNVQVMGFRTSTGSFVVEMDQEVSQGFFTSITISTSGGDRTYLAAEAFFINNTLSGHPSQWIWNLPGLAYWAVDGGDTETFTFQLPGS